MINTNELYIVNYCHPNCRPFQNIMRLPKEQAFKKAKELAENNPEAQAFYRFADFENYYTRRLKDDDIIRELDSLELSTMTPLDAMNTLYRLQTKLKNRWKETG